MPGFLDILMPRGNDMLEGERGWSSSRGWGGHRTRAGVNVDEISALNYSAVFCATRIICETLASLPRSLYERTEDNGRLTSDLPVGALLRTSPNPDMTIMPFVEALTQCQVNCGNGFAEIERAGYGDIVALHPIHAFRVSPTTDPDIPYRVQNNSAGPTFLRASEMLHIPGVLSGCGVWGKGIIQFARESIGGAIGTERHGHAFFGSGAQPKGVFETPGLKRDEDRAAFRREWKEIHASPDSAEIAIVPINSKYTPITLTNNDNQFLETRRFNRETIATWYRVPPYMLGEKITHANIEQASIEFVIYSIYPWVRRWEEQCNFKLLTRQQQATLYFEHNFAGLLRGDIAARYNAYRIALSTGFMTINEVRRLENMNGIGPEGDEHYLPLNLTTAKRMATGDVPAGGNTGLGSDQSGLPADAPPDQGLNDLMRQMPKANRSALTNQLRQLERSLEERKPDYTRVARLALVDVLGRLLTKEANAAQGACDKKRFDSWIREFYPRHEAAAAEWLETACAALDVAGVKQWSKPAELAGWLRARSVEALQASYNSDTPLVFARKLEAWPTERAKAIAAEILGEAA